VILVEVSTLCTELLELVAAPDAAARTLAPAVALELPKELPLEDV